MAKVFLVKTPGSDECHSLDDNSTLVQVKARCCQAASDYLRQRWPRFMSPYGITRPVRIKYKYFLSKSPARSGRVYMLRIPSMEWSKKLLSLSALRGARMYARHPYQQHQRTWSSWLQTMSRRMFGTKPLPELMLRCSHLHDWEKFQWISDHNTQIFIQVNGMWNVVCNLSVLLWFRWVK